MKKIMVLLPSDSDGDWPPVMTVALGLRKCGHELVFSGDRALAATLPGVDIETLSTAIPEHELRPHMIAELIQQRLAKGLLHARLPDLLLTSLFGAEVTQIVSAQTGIPWCVINSTFYFGPPAPRSLESDFDASAVPLVRDYFLPLLEHASLVLHATDPVFDYHNTALPTTHHYVGPLLWEIPAPIPPYLAEPGDPWVLVTLSSSVQDDLPLAHVALTALAPLPVRVVLTIGNGHQTAELQPVPPNAHVEHYVPHSAVLERSRLLLSHAGHGAVMKALWYGAPLVLVPWDRDQPGVATRAEHLGVARVVARYQLTDALLTEAIRDVLEVPRYQQNAQMIAHRLRAEAPIATACRLIEQL